MKEIILFDNGSDDYSFLTKEFKDFVYSPDYKHKLISWLCGCINALRRSQRNDVIICWFDFQAVLLYWLSLFSLKKRKIICLNILLKDKKTLKNKIVTMLYRMALSSKNFKATITSVEYGEYLNRKFNKSFNYTLMHDVFRESYEIQKKECCEENTVFCGGRNGRDWGLFFEIATQMPEIKFKAIVPSEIKKTYADKILLSNVLVRENIPYKDFLQEMCSSEIVIMPLDTDAPAGLIVMFQAAANEKKMIVSDTPVTREYIIDGRGYRVENDVEKWVEQIRFCLKNKEEAKTCAMKLKNYLINECSEKKFIKTIRGIYD